MRKVQGVVEAVKPDEEMERFETWGDYRYWLFGLYGTIDHVLVQSAQTYSMHALCTSYLYIPRKSLDPSITEYPNSLIPNSQSEKFAHPKFAIRRIRWSRIGSPEATIDPSNRYHMPHRRTGTAVCDGSIVVDPFRVMGVREHGRWWSMITRDPADMVLPSVIRISICMATD